VGGSDDGDEFASITAETKLFLEKSLEDQAAAESELADAKNASEESENALILRREEMSNLKKRKLLGSRYKAEAAKEVLRLFPKERYISIIQSTDDETELYDVQNYLTLLLYGAEKIDAKSNDKGKGSSSSKSALSEEELLKKIKGIEDGEGDDDEGYPETMQEENSTALEGQRRRLRRAVTNDVYRNIRQLKRIREFVEYFSVLVSDYGDAMRYGHAMKKVFIY